VRAQVDETDIGKVKEGQNASISLDAYPDTKSKAKVEHIYYESKTINNVTIYEVDLFPQSIPEFFRSGMNTTINFITQSKEDVLLIPSEAVLKEKEGDFVYVERGNGGEPEQRQVTLGIADDKNVEVISGIQNSDTLIVRSKKFSLPKSSSGTNPFMPQRARERQSR
jgi:macrolide-specific efflux system membrane fusion protein